MKDLFGAFGSEIFRPLATLVLPGLLALFTWTVVVVCDVPWVADFAKVNHAEFSGVVIVIATFLGLVFEDVGSRIENKIYDIHSKRDESGRIAKDKDWYPYLQIAFSIEPVGHRYLRTLVLRLKFELGCFSASLVAAVGVMLWNVAFATRLGVIAGLLIVGGYLFNEAWTGVKVIAEVRCALLQEVREVPPQIR
jgi:hypothetical protein